MKIKVSAIFEIDKNLYGTDEEEMQWFREMIADKENTILILHNNDIGDTIGETFEFHYEIFPNNNREQLKSRQ